MPVDAAIEYGEFLLADDRGLAEALGSGPPRTPRIDAAG